MRLSVLAVLLGLFALGIAAHAAPGAYRLGPEDAITVSVLRHPEFSGDFLIPPDGMIDLPFGGQVAANGRTLEELAARITAQLAERLRKPEVNVTLRTPRAQRVYVLGAVAHPGIYDLKPEWHIAEALAAAGGLTVAEDEAHATVMRDGQSLDVQDLGAALHSDDAAGPALQHGDVLKFDPLRTASIMIAGKVKVPGTYQIRDGEGLVEALTLAGGATDDAMLTRITIVRQAGQSEIINLAPAIRDGRQEFNAKLHAGDLVIVPEATGRIAVFGLVNQPGYYPVHDGRPLTLVDAMSLAGGAQSKNTRLDKVALIRTLATGEQQRSTYDLAKFLKTGDASLNPEIKPGDVVFVPEDGKTDWDQIFRGLSAIGAFLGPLSIF